GDAAQDRGLAAARRAEQGGHALGRRGKGRVERKRAERALEVGLDRLAVAHARARAKRFSIRIIDRMTAKANTTMPPASRLASRHRIVSTKSKIAVDMTLVRPGMLPPIISMTPNSPTVWAKPSTAPLRRPGLASGSATVQKARRGEARSVAAASIGRSPIAAKALRIGCTTKGIEAMIEPMTRPQKVKASVRAPQRLAIAPPGPEGPSAIRR